MKHAFSCRSSVIGLLSFFAVLPSALSLAINISRVVNRLTALATHNDLTPPAVQRILYTDVDVSARAYLRSLFADTGLLVREDSLGNIFGTWPGPSPGILTGSHFDAIPNSGMYDGTLGVLAALEAISALRESGYTPAKAITVIAFTSEEPTRFGVSCLGSRVLSGALDGSALANLSDSEGISFHAARIAAGYSGPIDHVALSPDAYTAFIELHSEQGPLLELAGDDIAAVTAIAAPAALEVTFSGPGGHAGTTLMPTRHDPVLAAAELALIVEAAVKTHGSRDTVGTTGVFDVLPNAINSVPTRARIGIDVRDIELERRDRVLEVVESAARLIARKRQVGFEFVVKSRDPPAVCNTSVVDAVMEAAEGAGLKAVKMVSRAYHDSLFMARRFPTGMIFVPCRDGVSHRPDEFVSEQDVGNGVRVLADVLRRLAGERGDPEKGDQRDKAEIPDAVMSTSGEGTALPHSTPSDRGELEEDEKIDL